MNGYGIYSWKDGRLYEGFYRDDKKHGYGVYTWSDQKKYAGYWHDGKQHGLGQFFSADQKRKLGIWEDGKKLRWFSSDEGDKIEKNQINLTNIFKNEEESLLKMKEFPLSF